MTTEHHSPADGGSWRQANANNARHTTHRLGYSAIVPSDKGQTYSIEPELGLRAAQQTIYLLVCECVELCEMWRNCENYKLYNMVDLLINSSII